MKYFKFAPISEESGISWIIEQPLSGPSLPIKLLPGLRDTFQLAQDSAYYIGTVDDTALSNPNNYIFEITAEERAQYLKDHVNTIRIRRLENIYKEEKELRKDIFNIYDESAIIAGIYKYEEAKAFVVDNTVPAPALREEALLRNIDPLVLAQRIISNHEKFRSDEARIAGIRGLLLDRLNNFSFDLQAPDDSLQEFGQIEKIGERPIKIIQDGEMVDSTEDVVVGKYDTQFFLRFTYVGQ